MCLRSAYFIVLRVFFLLRHSLIQNLFLILVFSPRDPYYWWQTNSNNNIKNNNNIIDNNNLWCHGSGHFRKVTPAQHSNTGMCSSGYSGRQQRDKICTLATTHVCFNISGILGSYNVQAVEFVQDLVRELSFQTRLERHFNRKLHIKCGGLANQRNRRKYWACDPTERDQSKLTASEQGLW